MWRDSYEDMQPRVSAATPCLYCGRKKGKHDRVRTHPFRPKFPNMLADGGVIDSETASVSFGPFSFDVEMAREMGWSTKSIIRVLDKIRGEVIPAGKRTPSRDADEQRRYLRKIADEERAIDRRRRA